MLDSTLNQLLCKADDIAVKVGADGRTVRILALQLLTWINRTKKNALPVSVEPVTVSLYRASCEVCFLTTKKALDQLFPAQPPLPGVWNSPHLNTWLEELHHSELGIVSPQEIHELVTRSYQRVGPINFVDPDIVNFMVESIGNIEGKHIYCPFDSSGQFTHAVAQRGGSAHWHSPVPYAVVDSVRWLCDLDYSVNIGNPMSELDNNNYFATVGIFPGRPLLGGKDIEKIQGSLGEPEAYYIDRMLALNTDRAILLVSGTALKHHNVKQQREIRKLYNSFGFRGVVELTSARVIGANSSQFVLDIVRHSSVTHTVFAKAGHCKYSDYDGRKKAHFTRWRQLVTDMNSLYNMTTESDAKEDNTVTLENDEPALIAVKRSNVLTASEVRLTPGFYLSKLKIDTFDRSDSIPLSELVEFIRPTPIISRIDDDAIDYKLASNSETCMELATSEFANHGYTVLIQGPQVILKSSKSTLNAKLLDDDIVMLTKGAEGSIGRVAIVKHASTDGSKVDWCVSQMSMIIRLKRTVNKTLNPKALYMFFQIPATRAAILGLVSTDLVRNLRAEELGRLEIPTSLLNTTASRLTDSFETLDNLESKMITLRAESQRTFESTVSAFLNEQEEL